MRRCLLLAAGLVAVGVGIWVSGVPARFGLGQTPSPYRPEAERDSGIKQLISRLKELPEKSP